MTAGVKVTTLTSRDVARCPKQSLLPGHYHADGTCRCPERVDAQARVDALVAQRRALAAELAEAREDLHTA